jgi:outer membrane protein OmpA-like peptidoglycan-associated protein
MTAKWTRHRPPSWVPAVVAIVGLGAIALGQGFPNRHSIQDNLTQRSAAALQQAGISGAEISFIGRDGSVRVTAQDQIEEARRIVANLEGVRVVDVSAPPVLKAPQVTLTVDNGQVSASGVVPTEAAKSALGATQNTATVDAGVTGAGLSGLAAVAKAFGSTAKGTIELRDGKLTLTGSVEKGVKDAILKAAGDAVGAGNVIDQLTVLAPPPEVIQRALTDLPQITFENNSATLTAAGQAAVAEAAAILRDNPTARVRIEGHTDSNGGGESNLALSRARAQTVLTTLVSLGIAADRLASDGFGESRPRVPDTTPENKAINRRVEFIVL